MPFADIDCSTLIAHASNDGGVPVELVRHAAAQIAGAELMVVEPGHHLLPACEGFDAIEERQLTLTAAVAD